MDALQRGGLREGAWKVTRDFRRQIPLSSPSSLQATACAARQHSNRATDPLLHLSSEYLPLALNHEEMVLFSIFFTSTYDRKNINRVNYLIGIQLLIKHLYFFWHFSDNQKYMALLPSVLIGMLNFQVKAADSKIFNLKSIQRFGILLSKIALNAQNEI